MGQPFSSGFGAGAGVEVFAAQAVAVAFEGEDFGVVDEPVDHGGGDGVVAEDLAPGAERLVAGDDHRGAFVAGGDEAEHEVRGFGIEGDVADLVDDDQRDEGEPAQLGLELALAFGFAEPGDPLGRGRELHALAGEAGADPERDREVRFAGPGRAEQDHVLAAVEEVELAEVLDDRLLHRALEA